MHGFLACGDNLDSAHEDVADDLHAEEAVEERAKVHEPLHLIRPQVHAGYVDPRVAALESFFRVVDGQFETALIREGSVVLLVAVLCLNVLPERC